MGDVMGLERALSNVEHVKEQSRGLRGRIASGLMDNSPAFDMEGYNLLKFHGIYQGYDRDSATARKQAGLGKAVQFMVRARLPGGRLTAAQYLALDAVAERYGNATLRVTTRQGIQFHGVVKRDLKATVAAINEAMVTTLSACGDVVRNVTTVPAPIRDAVHTRLEADARRLSSRLLPSTGAYHEIWLDGERVGGLDEDALFGPAYLPRKFKVGLAVPEDNSIDVLANDLAILARFEGGRLRGYDFLLGGSLGMTHNKPKTYPRLATPVAFVEPDDLVAAAEAVVRLHRDHGDRADRKHARLKYLIAERGEAWAKAQLESYLGKRLAEPRPLPRLTVVDHLGWHDQGDGKLYLGLPIASGRIADRGEERLRTALREAIRRFRLDPILTPSQDILLSNIERTDRPALHELLRAHGVVMAQDLTPLARWALACPALPTCGLALTEAERVRDPLVAAIEARLERQGLRGERISLRLTGCPNGCARPYTGDIGLVGRMPGFYALYVGGDFEGSRLSFNLVDKLAEAAVPDVLETLFAFFARERSEGESFGDFCERVGAEPLRAILAGSWREAV
jgi:sulfite reductase (ferredoxin)